MHIGAADAPVRRDGAFRPAVRKAQQRPRAVWPSGCAHVHLIAFEWRAIGDAFAGNRFQRLFFAHHGLDVEEAQSFRLSSRSLDALGISDALAQYLIAAANAQNPAAPTPMGANIDVPALGAIGGEIRERGL